MCLASPRTLPFKEVLDTRPPAIGFIPGKGVILKRRAAVIGGQPQLAIQIPDQRVCPGILAAALYDTVAEIDGVVACADLPGTRAAVKYRGLDP